MVLLFLGPPGSGKDTQAQILDQHSGFDVISTGDLIRKEMTTGSEIGMKLKEYYDKGLWTPDDLTYKVLQNNLAVEKERNVILTGAVRRLEQIPMLDTALEHLGMKLDRVINFDLPEDKIVERVSGRRFCPVDNMTYHIKYNPPKVEGICDKDGTVLVARELDRADLVRKRYEEHKKNAQPILDKYKERGILVNIDATPGIPEITARLKEVLQLESAT